MQGLIHCKGDSKISVPFLFFLCVANVPSCGAAYLICSAFSRGLMLLYQCVESKVSTPHDKKRKIEWQGATADLKNRTELSIAWDLEVCVCTL